jgi:hypothetical protein
MHRFIMLMYKFDMRGTNFERMHMINNRLAFPGKNNINVTPDAFAKSIWVSSGLAMIFALPPLVIFLGIYLHSSNLVAGVIVGFGFHFVLLGLSPRISERLYSFLED